MKSFAEFSLLLAGSSAPQQGYPQTVRLPRAEGGGDFNAEHLPSLSDSFMELADERFAKQLQAELDAEDAAARDHADSQFAADRAFAEQMEMDALLAWQLSQEQEPPNLTTSSCPSVSENTPAPTQLALAGSPDLPAEAEVGKSVRQEKPAPKHAAQQVTAQPDSLPEDPWKSWRDCMDAKAANHAPLPESSSPVSETAQLAAKLHKAKLDNDPELCAICLESPSTAGFVHGKRWEPSSSRSLKHFGVQPGICTCSLVCSASHQHKACDGLVRGKGPDVSFFLQCPQDLLQEVCGGSDGQAKS